MFLLHPRRIYVACMFTYARINAEHADEVHLSRAALDKGWIPAVITAAVFPAVVSMGDASQAQSAQNMALDHRTAVPLGTFTNESNLEALKE